MYPSIKSCNVQSLIVTKSHTITHWIVTVFQKPLLRPVRCHLAVQVVCGTGILHWWANLLVARCHPKACCSGAGYDSRPVGSHWLLALPRAPGLLHEPIKGQPTPCTCLQRRLCIALHWWAIVVVEQCHPRALVCGAGYAISALWVT